MAQRRRINGKPLLLATAGAALVMGCSGGNKPPDVRTGNLMPPPMVKAEVCVDKTPDTATVRVNEVVATERCTTVETHHMITVKVSAPGYVEQTQELPAQEKIELSIALVEGPEAPPPPPVGNLMPPPREDIPPPAPEK